MDQILWIPEIRPQKVIWSVIDREGKKVKCIIHLTFLTVLPGNDYIFHTYTVYVWNI